MKNKDQKHYIGQVRVGPKGQIVIPKEVRQMFGIEPGDSLLLLADADRGIALERTSVFAKIAKTIFAGRGKEVYPDRTEEEMAEFAHAIEQVQQEAEEE